MGMRGRYTVRDAFQDTCSPMDTRQEGALPGWTFTTSYTSVLLVLVQQPNLMVKGMAKALGL